MPRPILVLQYPDSRRGRTVAIAATRSPEVLQVFKRVVLDESRLACMDCDDEVLSVQDEMEFSRLKKVLNLLVPEGRLS